MLCFNFFQVQRVCATTLKAGRRLKGNRRERDKLKIQTIAQVHYPIRRHRTEKELQSKLNKNRVNKLKGHEYVNYIHRKNN